MEYGVKERDTLVVAQIINRDGIWFIRTVIGLTEKLTESAKTHIAYDKKNETEISRLMGIYLQRILMQQKSTGTLAYGSGPVV